MPHPRIAASVIALLIACQPVAASEPADTEPLSYLRSLELLRGSNRAMLLARRLIDASASDLQRADVAPNPNLSLSTSNSRPRHFRPPEIDWIVRFEQTIERGGKRDLRIASAGHLLRASRHDLAEIERQQRVRLAAAYFELLRAQHASTLAGDNLETYNRLIEAARIRLRAGDIAAVDVNRLEVEAGRARNESQQASAELAQARIELAAVLGLEDKALRLRAADAFLPLDAVLPVASLLEQVIEQRADIVAVKARIDALETQRRLAIAQRTRDITVGIQTERSPSLGGQIFALSASVPLMLNNDYRGEIARAEADLASAREDLARLQAQVGIEAARARTATLNAKDKAVRLEGESIPAARRAAAAIEFAFGRGAATLTDLLDARRQMISLTLESISAQADMSRSLIAWREALRIEGSEP